MTCIKGLGFDSNGGGFAAILVDGKEVPKSVIAAAEDLLAALEALRVPRNRTETLPRGRCFCRCVNDAHDETMPQHHPKCTKARAAIAKAKGE